MSRQTNEMGEHSLYTPDQNEEEKELNNILHSLSISRSTAFGITDIIEVIDPRKYNHPAGVRACCIECRFGGILHRIIRFYSRLDVFRDVAP